MLCFAIRLRFISRHFSCSSLQCYSISCLLFLVPAQQLAARRANANVNAFIDAYRAHGHRTATINPIDVKAEKEEVPELNALQYGLEETQEIARLEGLIAFSDSNVKTVADLKKKLTEIYCQNVSAEFSFIECERERGKYHGPEIHCSFQGLNLF